jgi:hypothetical protein
MVADTLERSLNPGRTIHERQPYEPGAEDEDRDAADAEEQHDDEWCAEDGVAGRERADRQREHRDGVDHAEREDRERDRVEAEPHAAEPAQCPDLDDVVETEREHDSARSCRATRREAATSVWPFAWEQPLPAERTQEEAREVRDCGGQDECHVCLLQRPIRRCESSCREEACADDRDGECNACPDLESLPSRAARAVSTHVHGRT